MSWLEVLFIPVAIAYLLVVLALFIYGINFLYLSLSAWSRHRAPVQSPLTALERLPSVTVQLPIYNEWYVATRLISAAAALEYPRDLLEIQVLDDSTDETVAVAERAIQRFRCEGIRIAHVRRTDRRGYKAGALADGLEQAHGEFIAIFDADFVPPPDFLRRILPHFDSDRVAFVQARWSHLNRDYSLLTFLQSLAIDAHFAVEQLARADRGFWFNFNGTAGIWRKQAIVDAGGWTARTLTEDLDLSYRAFLRGWEARYAGEIEVPAELPVSFAAYRRQQHRWARGSFECALYHLPGVWQSHASLPRKVESTLHLTGYGVHLLLFALTLLYPVVLLVSKVFPGLVSLFGIAVLFNFTALAPTIYFLVGQQTLGRRWVSLMPSILFMTILGGGMMLNTARAAYQAGTGRQGIFERTPKYGIAHSNQAWDGSRYGVRIDGLVLLELALAALNLWTTWLSWQTSNWLTMIYAFLFAFGLLFTSGMTLAQSIRQRFFTAK